MPSEHSDSDSSKLTQYRDPDLATKKAGPIGFYERELYVLSNFASFQVEWKGRLWPTSEHAYQASKFMGVSGKIVSRIQNAKSAHKAFKLAKEQYSDQARDDWTNKKRIEIMEEICWLKLVQHEYVLKKLVQTGNRRLVEDSPKDDFWGWGPNQDGRNELGKLWMRFREYVKFARDQGLSLSADLLPRLTKEFG